MSYIYPQPYTCPDGHKQTWPDRSEEYSIPIYCRQCFHLWRASMFSVDRDPPLPREQP